MNNVTDLAYNDPTTKSYATRANAVKAVEKLVAHREDKFWMTVTVNEAGRFIPVVMLTEKQVYMAGAFACKSIPVVRV